MTSTSVLRGFASHDKVIHQPRLDYLDAPCETTTTMLPDQTNRSEPTLQKRCKRVSNACDKCRALRTRCDGMDPCQRCKDYNVVCAYTSIPRRRGRKGGRARTSFSDSRDDSASGYFIPTPSFDRGGLAKEAGSVGPQAPREFQQHEHIPLINHESALFVFGYNQQPMDQVTDCFSEAQSAPLADTINLMELMESMSGNGSQRQETHEPRDQYVDLKFEPSRSGASPFAQTPESFLFIHPARSISSEDTNATAPVSSTSDCKYPVLQPLLPFLNSIITSSQACHLLDFYFAQPSNSVFRCASPYVLTPIFRKKSFLRRDTPRKTSPALLAAILWATASTSDAQFLGNDTWTRSTVCDALFQVCIDTLKIESQDKPRDRPTHKYVVPYMQTTPEGRCPWELERTDADLVLAFVLIGIVISGGDTRRDCLKWWASAWALAKNLKLNCEVEDLVSDFQSHGQQSMRPGASNTNNDSDGAADTVLSVDELAIEETKEERRRIWWLLYITDRHLALSYNSRLNILDAECRIYQPLNEAIWQDLDLKTRRDIPKRILGPISSMTGVGLFEYFLPLMTILGDIIEIHHLSCHPRFGQLNLAPLIDQAELSLNMYEESLAVFESSVNSTASTLRNNSCSDARTWPAKNITQERLTIVYSRHILHVLYVLLHGRWDPISMLDGTDCWLTPESFVKCATQALSAAEAVAEILELDPELRFMPYLFGVYMLHGSFILLLFAERMDMTASGTVSQAYETTIRAHEVCITTLNTEYQRDFRKVLCSALNAMRGVIASNDEEHGNRRRELLSRFRWTKDGKGLAN